MFSQLCLNNYFSEINFHRCNKSTVNEVSKLTSKIMLSCKNGQTKGSKKGDWAKIIT